MCAHPHRNSLIPSLLFILIKYIIPKTDKNVKLGTVTVHSKTNRTQMTRIERIPADFFIRENLSDPRFPRSNFIKPYLQPLTFPQQYAKQRIVFT